MNGHGVLIDLATAVSENQRSGFELAWRTTSYFFFLDLLGDSPTVRIGVADSNWLGVATYTATAVHEIDHFFFSSLIFLSPWYNIYIYYI